MVPERLETTFTHGETGEVWHLYRSLEDGSPRAVPISDIYGGRQIYIDAEGGLRTGPQCFPSVVQWFLDETQN